MRLGIDLQISSNGRVLGSVRGTGSNPLGRGELRKPRRPGVGLYSSTSVRRAFIASSIVLVVTGCGAAARHAASPPSAPTSPNVRAVPTSPATRTSLRASDLHLPVVRSPILPGYLLVADRNNNRLLLLSPGKRIVWRRGGLREPDDAFFTPGFGAVITNEEFNDTLAVISLASRRQIWSYGHAGVPGRTPGYLDSPDDAYRLASGITTVADIKNCRIVQIEPSGSIARVLGGSCAHDPPRGFASPNGDTPLPGGGLLVTEIGGWIDRLDKAGRLLWSIRSPVAYPSDAQLLPDGHILVCGFTTPGKVVELTQTGRVVWSFGASSGENRLDRPSLAIRLPNGLIAINDDWRHRLIIIDPKTSRIVWQYGHTDAPSAAVGYLDKPDGMDFLPAAATATAARAVSVVAKHSVTRTTANPLAMVRLIGRLPEQISRLAAVALPDGRIIALGGLVNGTSSANILGGPPTRIRRIGTLPAPAHDAAAVVVRGRVELLGGGQTASSADVTQIDPSAGTAKPLHPLDEPLSDLGATVIRGHVYLVGGYTGSRFARAVLEVGARDRTTTVARLPAGVRYAGVATLNGWIYVAGGLTPAGSSDAVYRVDVTHGTVKRIGTLPNPLAHGALVAAHGALWLVGGDGSRDVLRIDPRTGTSRIAATLPHPLINAAAVALPSGRIIVLGGDSSDAIWQVTPTG